MRHKSLLLLNDRCIALNSASVVIHRMAREKSRERERENEVNGENLKILI